MAEKKQKIVEIGLRRFWGVALLPVSLFLLLSLLSYDWHDIAFLQAPPNSPSANLIGPIGAWLSFLLLMILGVGAYLVPLWCLLFACLLIFRTEIRLWPRLIWCLVLTLSVTCLLELHEEAWSATCWRLNIADSGGIVSGLLTRGVLVRGIGNVGTGLLLWSAFAVSLVLFVGPMTLVAVFLAFRNQGSLLRQRYRESLVQRQDKRTQIDKQTKKIDRAQRRIERQIRKQELRAAAARESAAAEPERPVETPRKPRKPLKAKKPTPAPTEPPKEAGREVPDEAPDVDSAYILPPITLLDETPAAARTDNQADDDATANVLVETLREFGITAEVTSVKRGPVVTRYELLPAPGVRVERIAGLSNNLSLSLKATSVRVQAPVPGKGVVGVEVPNAIANMVSLREMLEGKTWNAGKAKLPLVLGKDVGGKEIVADLAEMPHLLIAGATGSGKTVCMNSVLAGLLMARKPDDLRLMLVDPKIVEFSAYERIPHLVVPVITNAKKVAIGLRWAIAEMEKRYRLFAKVAVRNIESYNNRIITKQEDLFDMAGREDQGEEPPAKLPYIVIVIDELADLMLVAQADIENCVARLAQLSRAVGIHMILSTQRPSVNVITGTIKANFPARIAFQVAQKVDSRTILDAAGADKLLGRGDMLFLPPGTSRLLRAQGALTTDEEIKRIADFIREQAEPVYDLEIQEKMQSKTESQDNGEDDELVTKAAEIIRETQRASVSSLQRRLRIGYTRAARIMDILEERGVVGPPRGSEPREILVDLDVGMPQNAADEVEDDVEEDDEVEETEIEEEDF
ncbi:MAG: DNA translocase FtsK [Lentisphaerae bacterium]|nr:DNA translocase FtsK [Lentisphaerota bacterium]